MDFYEKHKAERNRFEILAFHDATAKSFEELDKKLEKTVAEAWKGRTLPFPVLLDATGETIKRFGITAFPTTVLLDPDGKVVKNAGETTLEEKLKTARRAGK